MMPVKTMTLEQVRIAGYQALTRELGPINLVRFLQQFETGYGDYTQERGQWLDRYTIEEIAEEIQDRRDVE
jgi:hypothetical protein